MKTRPQPKGKTLGYSGGFEKKDLIRAVQRVMRGHEGWLTYEEWGKDPRLPSGPPVTNRFGSWENFMNEAGFLHPLKTKNQKFLDVSGGWIIPRRGAPYQWEGTRSLTKDGYIRLHVPTHPNANGKGHIMEHRFVMAEHLGRPLRPDEIIHHRNGIKADNRPSNLEIVSKGAHNGEVACPYCHRKFGIK